MDYPRFGHVRRDEDGDLGEMIDFDARKHAGTRELEPKLRWMMQRYDGHWADQQVMDGPSTHQLRIRQWLCKKAHFSPHVCQS